MTTTTDLRTMLDQATRDYPAPWAVSESVIRDVVAADLGSVADTASTDVCRLIAAAPELCAEVLALREERATMLQLIRDMVDPDPCWFDHNGGCQAHVYLTLKPGELCPHAEAKALLGDQ